MQLDYIQDLEGGTVAYVFRNSSCQAIVFHVTTKQQEENNQIPKEMHILGGFRIQRK